MAGRFAWLNGRLVKEEDAKIPVLDAAVLFGETVTETVRTVCHAPFRAEAHLERLSRSLRACRLEPPMAPQELARATRELIAGNEPSLAPGSDWRIDYNITPGPYDLEREVSLGRPTVSITATPLPFAWFGPLYVRGCHVVTPITRWVPGACIDPQIKHHSRMHYRIANREAQLVDGGAVALMLDLEGQVAECTGGNFFIVQGDTLVTAATTTVLGGITREETMTIARRLGLRVEERPFHLYDVYNADEAFQTSTPFFVMPVTKANRIAIAGGEVGRTTLRIMEGWNQVAGLDVVAQALSHIQGREREELEEARHKQLAAL
ncbi:MAG: aminotransferase class IV [Planctomycetota bacterium]